MYSDLDSTGTGSLGNKSSSDIDSWSNTDSSDDVDSSDNIDSSDSAGS